MALPPHLRSTFSPAELELIACEELIEIQPLIAMERTAFISGAYGPLRPPLKAKIPIWMAVNLKLKKKCNIVPPDWLRPENLREKLQQETNNPGFSEMPLRFAEIAKVLLDVASDDVQESDKVRSLLKDIREVRQAKSRDGLQNIDRSELALANFASMEINEIRPFYTRAMDIFTQLHFEGAPANDY
ncbi:DNA replication complex GINS protein PSF2 [Peniophora sp. CONT]|nr:DNA replication complex GINS protein PSF2 [Peniophora sp. CONT]